MEGLPDTFPIPSPSSPQVSGVSGTSSCVIALSFECRFGAGVGVGFKTGEGVGSSGTGPRERLVRADFLYSETFWGVGFGSEVPMVIAFLAGCFLRRAEEMPET